MQTKVLFNLTLLWGEFVVRIFKGAVIQLNKTGCIPEKFSIRKSAHLTVYLLTTANIETQ